MHAPLLNAMQLDKAATKDAEECLFLIVSITQGTIFWHKPSKTSERQSGTLFAKNWEAAGQDTPFDSQGSIFGKPLS
jgi:hypothetical protein